ncbi:hypothetical protein [Nocardia barduliensis]|uniref:hypothetical protein n=1 Tax=Nocardia barduliensis TaxID=2736643 RepID=UPI0015748C40|nr:hypothetical protein [Nocardia barduliensis]
MLFASGPHATGALISSTASAGTGTFFDSPSKIRTPLSAASSSRASLVVAEALGAAAALVDVGSPLADGSSEHPDTEATTSAGIAIQLIFTVRPLVAPARQAIDSDQPGTEHDNGAAENLGYTPRNSAIRPQSPETAPLRMKSDRIIDPLVTLTDQIRAIGVRPNGSRISPSGPAPVAGIARMAVRPARWETRSLRSGHRSAEPGISRRTAGPHSVAIAIIWRTTMARPSLKFAPHRVQYRAAAWN